MNSAVTDFLRAMGAEHRAGLWVAPGTAAGGVGGAGGFDIVAQREELQEAKERFLDCTFAAARERRGLPLPRRRNSHRARTGQRGDAVQCESTGKGTWCTQRAGDGDEGVVSVRDKKGWAGAV